MSFAQYSLITNIIFGEGSIPALTDIVKDSPNSGQVAIITDAETCSSQLDFLQQALPNLGENPVFKAADNLTMESVTQLTSELNGRSARPEPDSYWRRLLDVSGKERCSDDGHSRDYQS